MARARRAPAAASSRAPAYQEQRDVFRACMKHRATRADGPFLRSRRQHAQPLNERGCMATRRRGVMANHHGSPSSLLVTAELSCQRRMVCFEAKRCARCAPGGERHAKDDLAAPCSGAMALAAMPDRALAENLTCSERAPRLIDDVEDGDVTTPDGAGGWHDRRRRRDADELRGARATAAVRVRVRRGRPALAWDAPRCEARRSAATAARSRCRSSCRHRLTLAPAHCRVGVSQSISCV
jgi:hypothetical protein